MDYFQGKQYGYHNVERLPTYRYRCGFCSDKVASDKGFKIGSQKDGSGEQLGGVYICPTCHGPTFLAPTEEVYPSPRFGEPVGELEPIVESAYEEARRCTGERCYTAAVLLCRKVLMNVAVTKGAKAGDSFANYIDWLNEHGYIPPDGRDWVDQIRDKGNEATHKIPEINKDDAHRIVKFTQMLLQFMFELPAAIKPKNENNNGSSEQ